MNLAFADRDFYYGDPHFPPAEPTRGLLSKEYAKQRAATIRMDRNDANAGPGDPYPFQGGKNPYADQLQQQRKAALDARTRPELTAQELERLRSRLQERHDHGHGGRCERLARVGRRRAAAGCRRRSPAAPASA